jgi:Zn-dependent metalloprotease
MSCMCKFVPDEVLARLANDPNIKEFDRAALQRTLAVDAEMRRLREVNASLTISSSMIADLRDLAELAKKKPAIKLFDCKHGNILPGTAVASPQSSSDSTVKRTFKNTTDVAKFYQKEFGRNSLDGQGMDLISSVHYGVKYNNAFWNGQQMTYGDGDGAIFVDFTLGNDVVGHELTHGLTQFTLQLVYSNEPGGLNESMSDVFGSMFRQWEANQTVQQADWLIGADIMGPKAKAQGFTCLRDMANPGSTKALSPQPSNYSGYHPGMDPHQSSGIPNNAFYRAATAIGGKSWQKAGKIWFQSLTGYGPMPNMTMKQFADRTRTVATQLFGATSAELKAVDKAWKAVGL